MKHRIVTEVTFSCTYEEVVTWLRGYVVMLTDRRNVEDQLFHQCRNKELLTDTYGIGRLVVIRADESVY